MKLYIYNYYELLMLFYLYSFLGWCFESTYVSICEKRPVNRGFLRSPLLPLYGSGAVSVLFLSAPFKHSYLLTYIAGALGATLLELITGQTMEKLFKVKYWDYSDKKYNYKGYICLSSTLFWGFLTVVFINYIHPFFYNLVLHIKHTSIITIDYIVSVIFISDFAVSTHAALDFARAITALSKIKNELEEIQTKFYTLSGNVVENTKNHIYETGEKLNVMTEKIKNIGEDTNERIAGMKYKTQRLIAKLKEDIEERLPLIKNDENMNNDGNSDYTPLLLKLNSFKPKLPSSNRIITFFRRGMLKGNPDATSKFLEEFFELKEGDIFAGRYKRKKAALKDSKLNKTGSDEAGLNKKSQNNNGSSKGNIH